MAISPSSLSSSRSIDSSAAAEVLICREVSHAFGQTPVLSNVNLSLGHNKVLALLGPSGSGKSTLLRLIAGLLPLQTGRIFIQGIDVSDFPAHTRDIGLVFQNHSLWPHLNVWDNVAFGLVERKIKGDLLRERVGAALNSVGLSDVTERRSHQLSGGQQQRVALARALVINPKLLLLDEPLSNLDHSLRLRMRQQILSLQKLLQIPCILVTHDRQEALSMADSIAVMRDGKIEQIGSPTTLYDQPSNRFVAEFMGDLNFLDSKSLNLKLATGAWGLRPEAIYLAEGPQTPDEVAFSATVLNLEFTGPSFRCHAQINGSAIMFDLSRRLASARSLQIGQQLELRANKQHLHAFGESS
jgi:iron(III) transport system ATP-binding protein